jgi:hypothetical protein
LGVKNTIKNHLIEKTSTLDQKSIVPMANLPPGLVVEMLGDTRMDWRSLGVKLGAIF